ncbi:MAG: hypothetical protein ABI639_06850 [Thermoanaerobaculia bacterium]
MSRKLRIAKIGWLLSMPLAVPLAADVESDLQRDLVGRFALTTGDLKSECSDHYTDMKVIGTRASGGSGSRFEGGELVRIDNVHSGMMAGLDVNVSIVEPYLLSFTDGPFTVFDQRRCRVQLNFDVARDIRKDKTKSAAAIAGVLSLFDSESAARAASWNRRKVAAYPAGWEKTRHEYEQWKFVHGNELVRAKTEDVLDEAGRILNSMPSDDDYSKSFGDGARSRSSESWSDCEAMLNANFYSTGSAGSGGSSRGWSDGQHVAWSTLLAHALQACIREPPR